MTPAQPISLLNYGVPVLALAVAAWVLPAWLGRNAASQPELARWVFLSTGLMVVFGGLTFAAIYQMRGTDVGAAISAAPGYVAAYFARLAGLAALIWAPVMALAWYVLAQGVERRRGEAIAREGRT